MPLQRGTVRDTRFGSKLTVKDLTEIKIDCSYANSIVKIVFLIIRLVTVKAAVSFYVARCFLT